MTLTEICYSIAGEHDHERAEQLLEQFMSHPNFALAYHLISEGFSVIPLCLDKKRPARLWKQFQYVYASIEELKEWFIDHPFAPAIVTGHISGITVIDCDSDEAIQIAADLGIESTMGQRTRRGRHLVFRHAGERNTIAVGRIEGIDRRGEGGYVKAYADSQHWTREQVESAPFLDEAFA